VRRLYDLRYLG